MSRDSVAVIVEEMRKEAGYCNGVDQAAIADTLVEDWADRLDRLTREAAPQASDAADLLSKESCLLVNGQPRFRTMPDSATLQDYLDKLCIGMLTPVDQMALDNMLHDRLAATDSAQRRCTNPACGGRGYEDAWDLDGNWTGTACDECAAIMASPEPTDSAQAIQSQQGATGGAVLDEIYRRYTEMIAADWDRCERVDAIKETLLSLIEFALAHPQAAGSAPGEARVCICGSPHCPNPVYDDELSAGSVASPAGDALKLAKELAESTSGNYFRGAQWESDAGERLLRLLASPATGAGSAPVGVDSHEPT